MDGRTHEARGASAPQMRRDVPGRCATSCWIEAGPPSPYGNLLRRGAVGGRGGSCPADACERVRVSVCVRMCVQCAW